MTLVRNWLGKPIVDVSFQYGFDSHFGQQSWTFLVKTVLKHNKYPSIKFAISALVENDTSFVYTDPYDSRNITVYVFFQYGVGSHVWATILDFKGQDGLRT